MFQSRFSILTRSIRPPQITKVQTDGSFNISKISRTAVLMNTYDHNQYILCKTYFTHKNSTESEWRSVLDGLQFSIKKDQGAIELENDNQGVIRSIITKRPPSKPYLLDYYMAIYRAIPEFEYLGIRWIPRAYNRADDIFRI